jgi:hypothetical protein
LDACNGNDWGQEGGEQIASAGRRSPGHGGFSKMACEVSQKS